MGPGPQLAYYMEGGIACIYNTYSLMGIGGLDGLEIWV